MRKNNKTPKLPMSGSSPRTTLSLASSRGENARSLRRGSSPMRTRCAGLRIGFKIYAVTVLSVALLMSAGMTALAADDPIAVVNNLSDFIFGLIRAIGLILLGFGIVQVGLSLKSHDPSQRANGFLTLAGGIIITFAKEILGIITGG